MLSLVNVVCNQYRSTADAVQFVNYVSYNSLIYVLEGLSYWNASNS